MEHLNTNLGTGNNNMRYQQGAGMSGHGHIHGSRSMPENIDKVNSQCCCFNLRKIVRAVTQYFDHHLESSGIRSTQFTLLVALSATKARTLSEIAKSLVMDRTTLTRNLKPLEKDGLITSKQAVDKRSKGYALTALGQEMLYKALPLWQKAQDAMVNNLGEQRYKHLNHELEEMLAIAMQHKP
jgi:DNA-binding MarR family transcriptional regulator